MNSTKRYNRENCTNKLRKIAKDNLNRDIVLSGIHSYEYKITIQDNDRISSIKFKNRIAAEREFKRLTIRL